MKTVSIQSLREFAAQHDSKIIGRYNRSSVLVPIVEVHDELFILYEVRSETLNTQPGEVSFPGGKMDEGETPREAAVRETCEEIGVAIKDIEVLGELDRIRAYSNFTMYSFLGIINSNALKNAKFNEAEVKETFMVPISFFLENSPYVYECAVGPEIGNDFPYEKIKFKDGYNWRKGKTVIPIYEYEDRVIWGLTARITMNFINEIKEFL